MLGFEVFAKLMLDTSEFDEGMNDAENRSSNFGQGIARGARVIGTAIAGATTAVVGFAGTSVHAGMDFDSAMSQVAATMGTTTDQIGDLRDFAQEMGSTTAFSATQAAEALNYMALAGYDAETSMSMLPTVLDLAAAGGIALGEASDMVTDASSALGLSIEETSTMVDQMASASSASNTSVAQLGQAFLTVGATARNMAGGTAELSTVLGVMADNGIKGSEAGTHLRNILLSISEAAMEADDGFIYFNNGLERVGVEVYDAEGNMRDLTDIIVDMQAGMEGMDQASRDTVISGMFNRADLASVNALLGTSADRFDELRGRIEDSADAASDMANTQLDNLAGDITLFKSALEGAQITISDALTPSLRDFVQMGAQGLSDLTVAFQEGGLEGAMSALGDWLSDALSMIIDMTPDIISAGIQLLGALGQGLLDNAPVLVDSALEVMQYLLNAFYETTEGDGLERLLDTAFSIIEKLGNFMIANAPLLIETTVELIVRLVDYFTRPDNMIMMFNVGMAVLEAVATGLLNAAPQLISAIPMIIANLIVSFTQNFPTFVSTVLSLLGELGLAILESIAGLMGTSMEDVGDGLASLGDIISSGLASAYETVTSVLGDIGDAFGDTFVDIGNTVADGIEALVAMFDFDWELPNIRLPHFQITGGEAPYGLGGQGTFPSIGIEWYAKAYDQPMMFDDPTVFGINNGSFLGAGDGNGGEMIYGHDNLMNDITNAVASVVGNQPIVVQAYFGTEKFDEYVIQSRERQNFITGGR